MLRFLALHDQAARIIWAASMAPEIDAERMIGRLLSDWCIDQSCREELKTKLARCLTFSEPDSFESSMVFSGVKLILKLSVFCPIGLTEVRAITTARVVPFSVTLLSDREKECLSLLAMGKATKQIARQLRISPSTAETHLSRAKLKLGAASHDALLAFALEYLRD